MDDVADARLRRRERRIDEQLRELAAMGELSKLPGEGAPLVDDDPGAGDGWAARHIAKNANITPEFVELRREIADRRDRLVRRLRAHREWLEGRGALPPDPPAQPILDAAPAPTPSGRRGEAGARGATREINAVAARYKPKVPL